jgi:hypothetical protein
MDYGAVAHALFDAVQQHDYERCTAIMAPGCVVVENARTIHPAHAVYGPANPAWVIVRDLHYADRCYLPGGAEVRLRHEVRGTTVLDVAFRVPVTARLRFGRSGRVYRIEESFDPVLFSPLAEAIAARAHTTASDPRAYRAEPLPE